MFVLIFLQNCFSSKVQIQFFKFAFGFYFKQKTIIKSQMNSWSKELDNYY